MIPAQGLAVLQSPFRFGKQEESNFFILLGASFIPMPLTKTLAFSAVSNGVPSTVHVVLFLPSVTVCPALFTLCFFCRQ